ncbi:MAG TPA: sensor histidine kinase [Chloroflexota bacterium]|nr:sensor histidine kinase [Chloroflexota bacterium]
MDSYLIDVSLSRLRLQFDISEVTEGLLLWRETVLPLLFSDSSIGSAWQQENLSQLDEYIQHLVSRFGHLYAEAVHQKLETQRRRTAVMEDRQRLARELHDSVTQSLYRIALFAEAAAEQLAEGNPDRTKHHLQLLRTTAQDALREMRLLIFEAHPPVLEKEGLTGALRARLEAVETRGGLRTALLVEGVMRLPLSVEEELYHIAQEALNNVLKHARAQQVTVGLRMDEASIRIVVADDGDGFIPADVLGKGGMGLQGIQERAQRLGAKLSIDSTPEKGTRLAIEMPAEDPGVWP